MLRIGLISDTHGLLRAEALAFLHGCAHIVHAGDIGDAALLATLERIAPVTAVRGNNDTGAWADRLPNVARIALGGAQVCVLHDIAEFDHLAVDTERAPIQVLVTGHSHKPRILQRGGALHVNPGSAGPRRFSLPISVAELLIDGGEVTARLCELPIAAAKGAPNTLRTLHSQTM